MKTRTTISLLGIVAIVALILSVFLWADAASSPVARPQLGPGSDATVYLQQAAVGDDGSTDSTAFEKHDPKIAGKVVLVTDYCVVLSKSGEEYWIPWTAIVGIKTETESASRS